MSMGLEIVACRRSWRVVRDEYPLRDAILAIWPPISDLWITPTHVDRYAFTAKSSETDRAKIAVLGIGPGEADPLEAGSRSSSLFRISFTVW
jgi:hypothetical protein